MLSKTEPMPRYELTILRTGETFRKISAVSLASRRSFFTLGTRPDFPARSFYFELWTRPPWWQVWRSPTILFRGTSHDPLGVTSEYPSELTRHLVAHPPPEGAAEVVDGTESDFERRDSPRDAPITFLLIVPRYEFDTRLKLFSRDFARVFGRRDLTAAEIDLP